MPTFVYEWIVEFCKRNNIKKDTNVLVPWILSTTWEITHYHLFQDVVEERFDAEYLIAIAAAIGLLTVIAAVALALMLMRCRRNAHSRASANRRKKRSRYVKIGDYKAGFITNIMQPSLLS